MSEYNKVLHSIENTVEEMMKDQVMDENREDYGGYFSASFGFASPSHAGNASYLMNLILSFVMPDSKFYGDKEILRRIKLAIKFQKRCIRPSGFTDIPHTNFDCPSDTGFTIQQLASMVNIIKNAEKVPPCSGEIEEELKPYLTSSGKALANGGFHTPNHRWVITSAMSLVNNLYSEVDLMDAINAYLNEGIDLNADGEYSERSTGGYNAVCNRSLLITAEMLHDNELIDKVKENLFTMIDLMHADNTVVTSISRRQDKGKKIIPTKVTDSMYYMARKTQNDSLCAAAHKLLNQGGISNNWLAYWFMMYPEWRKTSLKSGKMPTSFSRYMPASGIWRVRRGKMSVTVATEVKDVFSLKYGEIEISGLRLHSPYFAGAEFTGRKIEKNENKVKVELRSDFLLPQLPGYWRPLDRPVAWKDLPFNNLDEREVNPRPELKIFLTVEEVKDGFDLVFWTEEGMERVPFKAELLFSTPGQIETETMSYKVNPGQTLYLKEGYLTYRNGNEGITIGPGFHGHRAMKGSEDSLFNVVMTDWTPVNRKLEVRCSRWTEAMGPNPAQGGPAAGFSE